MDKEYETYQFIETSTSIPHMNQLLVLQHDGTLVNMNREIQYVTQVQDMKEVIGDVRTCAVFDVSSQQLYVDVENTPDLAIEPDQFTIAGGDGNIYANSFLIQSETSTTVELMETETIINPALKAEMQEDRIEVEEANVSRPANHFTEVGYSLVCDQITLTDAQYHLLEEKGWIMLESGDRIYVLDTLGLRDITTDKKLIQKLQNELDGVSHQESEQWVVKLQEESPAEFIENDANDSTPLLERDETSVQQLIKPEYEANDNQARVGKEDSVFPEAELIKEKLSEIPTQKDLEPQKNYETFSTNTDEQQPCDSIRIKTKYTFSDIPDKIFLGKTINGKKLYAKVMKSKHREIMKKQNLEAFQKDIEEKAITVDNSNLINIIHDYIEEQPAKIKIKNVIAADSVVTQLMRLDHLKDTIMGNLVIVTKSVTYLTKDGDKKLKQKPTLITGEVKPLDATHGRFVHTPYMLHNITNPTSNTTEAPSIDTKKEFLDFVHIHVTETIMPKKPSSQSINVCNRKLSIDVIRNAKRQRPNPVYACGTCAAVFKSQEILEEHLENHLCEEADDALTIDDTDQVVSQNDSYYMLDTGKEKWYSCMLCEAKFLKYNNCQKHIQTHYRPKLKNPGSAESELDMKAKEYKCKMCSCRYYHASSLSKHIVKMHIRVRSSKQT